MASQNFTVSFLADKSPIEIFNAINNVRGWWTENLEGSSEKEGDEFSVRFGDIHFSKQQLIEVIPGKKVVWLVTDSRLNFIKDQSEWTNMTIVFDISKEGTLNKVQFTQMGLVPQVECYGPCSNAWTEYIQGSLQSLVKTGKGKPTLKEKSLA
ncbi:MAG: SRPBCC domain-containing protein [Chitinophagaceae bacterium]